MRFSVVTSFPELFGPFFETSLLGRAVASGRVAVRCVDPRDFAGDRHRTTDDTPYGGGPGMVMKPEPLVAAVEEAAAWGAAGGAKSSRNIVLSPAGAPLTQHLARQLAGEDHVILVCGRYEGIDQRVVDEIGAEEVSLGDFVMTGGEVAAMAAIDAASRYVPGVLGEPSSTAEESFSEGLLEYPHYTRPQSFRGREVPEVLRSGNHARIRRWRRAKALTRTAERRPDLLASQPLSAEDRELLGSSAPASLAARTYVILAHYPVFDRAGQVVTASIKNLDIHDIARSAATFGVGGAIAVTPITAQRDKVDHIVGAWDDQARREGGGDDHRIGALSRVWAEASLEDALTRVAERHGSAPLVAVTSAERGSGGAPGHPATEAPPLTSASGLHAACVTSPRPLAVVFGTGFGLAGRVIERADFRIGAISGIPRFNHLAVRSAVAIVLDRLFGLR